MRGKQLDAGSPSLTLRITPAHAGKTRPDEDNPKVMTDHPRACGENIARALAIACASGSPPRMRGKRHPRLRLHGDRRITPAHAGKTKRNARRATASKDHPRACGENTRRSMTTARKSGSPPRMRGKRAMRIPNRSSSRITPAHAGKTTNPAMLILDRADHPRACGENS